LSKKDDEIISKYLTGEKAEFVRKAADVLGGIDRVENGYFILANGTQFPIRSMSTFERWAAEDKARPADWLIISD